MLAEAIKTPLVFLGIKIYLMIIIMMVFSL